MPAPQRCEPLEQIFCKQCQKWTSLPCSSHAKRVRDAPVFPYSVASLPPILYLDVPQHGRAGKAVFAKEAIPPLTVFGPLISKFTTTRPANVAFACGSATMKELHYFQLESDQTTNWMKFVRFAQTAKEQNLAAYEVQERSPLLSGPDAVFPTQKHVIFVTTRMIRPGEELKVAYSLIYSQAIGCPVSPKSQVSQQTGKKTTPASHSDGQDHPDSSSVFLLLTGPPLLPSVAQSAADDTVNTLHQDPVRNVKKRHLPQNHSRPRSPSNENVVSLTDKENHTSQISIISDAMTGKRRKLSEESMDMPNFLPPDEVTGNLLEDLGCANACGVSALATSDDLVEPQFVAVLAAADVGEFHAAGNENIEEEMPELEVPVFSEDSGGSSQAMEIALQNSPVEALDALIEKMNSLKSRTHLGLRKTGMCLVCGARVADLPGHLDKMHTDENIQAVDDACFICHKKFKNRLALENHFKKVHRAKAAVPDAASQATALEFMCRTGYLNYRCSECRAVFPNRKLLDLHGFKHSPDHLMDQQQRHCSECPYIATGVVDLVEHIGQHAFSRMTTRHWCLLCGVTTRTTTRKHMFQKHPEAMKTIMEAWHYQCPECREKFADNSDLSAHVWRAHKGWQCVYCGYHELRGWSDFHEHASAHMMDQSFPCLVCKESFPEYHRLCIHIRDCHETEPLQHSDVVAVSDSAASAANPAIVERAIEHMRTTQKFSCYCDKCDRHFASFELLDLHTLGHSEPNEPQDDPRRNCPVCPFHGASFAELVHHTSEHRLGKRDSRPCLICGQNVVGMRGHISEKHPDVLQRITETWQYQCPECGERFPRRGPLTFHTKVKHTGLQCRYCARMFSAPSVLSFHVVEHSVNGEYPCPVCEKILPTYTLLNVHYQACHDATRLKTCSVCQTTCFGQDKLDEHMESCHSKTGERDTNTAASNATPRVCEFCGEHFKTYQVLYSHRLIAHLGKEEKKPPSVCLPCDQCGKSFDNKDRLCRHVRWVHMGQAKETYARKLAERKAAGVPSKPTPPPRISMDLADFKYKCEECQVAFMRQFALTKHNESRHPETLQHLSCS
ncbi:zinc finger protein Xfin-like [Paramacrobiotus metropolitanus]|uniref:zinc finger protein Xfin-like n=1 Tax=Paramacrobiotus metropolitanus TaxID=2943436 RepID=UPI0024463BDD|nr:zinc finger protein Xfin-like [Paramacrobiotus metropolitanus]